MSPASGLVALVVEDHDFQRHIMARMLRSLGLHDVLEARDGKEALKMIHSSPQIDLVVCDLDMPEMDGMELLRHLGHGHTRASVIICSAQDQSLLNSVEKMASAYGVNLLGAIEKPVSLIGLENLLALYQPYRPTLLPKAIQDCPFSLDQILDGLQRQQFEPFFQPKLDLESNQIIGAEALARWHHPEHGMISPYAFISVLEHNARLDELTLCMAGMAAEACRKWREGGLEFNVSVNLSLVSLSNTSLADQITDVVRSAGLDPHHMTLEITESAAMTEVAPALENLTRLRMRGFGLSVDDYGTGFSSLRQLTRVPFTELKIDQGFVTGFSKNPSSRTIVESSVNMAYRLGIKSVAEGVETAEDLALLKSLGCEIAQGFFIAKPMNKASFPAFCRAHASS